MTNPSTAKKNVSPLAQDFFYCLCLTLLAVGLKNFNPGLSLDGLIYAAVSQQVAVNNAYIRLDTGAISYSPFFEHPHLFFWITGTWLKFFPKEDWAIRIPSHICYFITLLWSFRFLQKHFNRETAIIFSLALISMGGFSQWFSNVYIDGMLILFCIGTIFFTIEKNFFGGGIFCALAFLTKGTTALALGPTIALITIYHGKSIKGFVENSAKFLLPTIAILILYFLLIAKIFNYPEFFEWHYSRHFTNRFSQLWDWSGVLSSKLWKPIFQQSLYLFVFVIIGAITKNKSKKTHFVVLTWVLTWALMYGGGGRFGGWYLLPFLIASAISFSIWLGETLSNHSKEKLILAAKKIPLIALTLIAFVQYTPIKIQYREVPAAYFELKKLSKEHKCEEINLDFECETSFQCSGLSWYSQTKLKASFSQNGTEMCALSKLSSKEGKSFALGNGLYFFPGTVKNKSK